jgi:hypothetical protein
MEHRESPRIAADAQSQGQGQARGHEVVVEGGDEPARPRSLRFEFARAPRRLDWIRLGVGLGVFGIGLWLAVYGGFLAVRSAISWLHDQPQYRLAFDEIVLDPPPPSWYLGGAETFLNRVREAAREDEILIVPSLERDRLSRAFKSYAWVRDDPSIRFSYPNRIRATLSYREPVARVIGPGHGVVILDADGVILPANDIAPDRLESLVVIGADALAMPKGRAAGLVWKTDGSPEDDRRVIAAAKLAGFYLQEPRRLDVRAHPGLRLREINANSSIGLFIWIEHDRVRIKRGEPAAFLWGEAPGDERPGDPTADQKWAMLRDYVESQADPLPPGATYWVFSKKGLIAHPGTR